MKIWVYAPIGNYPESVTGHKQGAVVGIDEISNYMWEHYPSDAPLDNNDLTTCRNTTEVLLENMDEFSKPIHQRRMGLRLLDHFEWRNGDAIIFLSLNWAISCLKDLIRLTSHLDYYTNPDDHENHSRIDFIRDDLVFTPHQPVMQSESLPGLFRLIDSAAELQRSLRSKFINFKKHERRTYVGGNVPMGFTVSPKGTLLPNWEQQKFIRLIAFLRDIAGLSWPKVRDRLIELYDKPGRRYPFVTLACVPWSYPQCYKGYKAWKRIQNGEI